jgi:hypothetical protein
MKKTVEQDGKTYTVRTVNGVNTITGLMWTREIVHFEPLANGFNLGLANHVYDIISRNQALWDQDSWRRLISLDDLAEHHDIGSKTEAKSLLKSLAAFDVDVKAPACGTAMCFAGWIGEVSGADYVYDAAFIKANGATMNSEAGLDYILVTREHPAVGMMKLALEDILSEQTLAILKSRGFTPETHVLTDVEHYAQAELGLLDGDFRNLFGGGNDLKDIRWIIEEYAEHGPVEL